MRLPQRAHVAGERVVVAQFLEGELACVEVGDAVGAQRVVAVVEVLRQFVDDFPLAGGGQRQRREARAQVRRPVPRRGARWSRVRSLGQALSTPVMRRIAVTNVRQVFRWLASTRRPSAVSR